MVTHSINPNNNLSNGSVMPSNTNKEQGITVINSPIPEVPVKPTTDYALKNQILVTTACSFIQFYSSGAFTIPGLAVPQIRKGLDDVMMTDLEISIFGAIVIVGAVLGSMLSSPLTNWLGQQKILFFNHILFVCAVILISVSNNVLTLMTFLTIQGISVGISACLTMSLLVEVCHVNVRSRLMGTLVVLRQCGFVYVICVGGFVSSWRRVNLICNLTASIFPLIILPFMHSSPRWLASKNRIDECTKSLKFYRGPNFDISCEQNDILKQVSGTATKGFWADLKILFKMPLLQRMLLLIYLTLALPFSGLIAITTYIRLLFSESSIALGLNSSSTLASAMRIFGTVGFMWLVGKLSNKKICFVSLIIATCSSLVMSLNLLFSVENFAFSGWVLLVSTCLFLYSICSATSVLMQIRGELLPTNVRATGLALQNVAFHAAAFLANMMFVNMVFWEQLHVILFLFTLNTAVLAFVFKTFVPKTSGRSLEELNNFPTVEKNGC